MHKRREERRAADAEETAVAAVARNANRTVVSTRLRYDAILIDTMRELADGSGYATRWERRKRAQTRRIDVMCGGNVGYSENQKRKRKRRTL